jgi:GTP-sensing pleiotropic transcriptional regulator CodY
VTADERDLWFAKAHRLEEDRLQLLRLLETLAETRLRLNDMAGGLTEAPEYRAVERRVMEQLTTLNDRQNGYIAEMMAFEPTRDGESGHLGGLAGDLAFVRRSRTREAALLNGRRGPVIAGMLLADVEQSAAECGQSAREWVEGAIRARLSGRAAAKPEGLQEIVRRLVAEEPLTAVEIKDRLGIPRKAASNALAKLALQGKVCCITGRRWVSTETP